MKIFNLVVLFLLASTILTHDICEEEYERQLSSIKMEISESVDSFDLFDKIFKLINNPELIKNQEICSKFNKGLKSENSLLSKIGMTLVYESKCAQEIGPVFLLLDEVVDSIKQKHWKEAIMPAIMTVLFAKQGINDCKMIIQAIIDMWKKPEPKPDPSFLSFP